MASIKYQIINSIDSAFGQGGHDRHSAKANEGTGQTVYSYSERENLKNTGIQLGEFCKNEYGVKQVKEITPTMISDFLKSKTTSCDKNTLSQYASRLNKLGNLINNRLSTANVNFKVAVPESQIGKDKYREVKMEKEDYGKVLQYAKDNNCTSKAVVAFQLSGEFALRVSEACKMQVRDIDLKSKTLHIHRSKGGLSRDLKIENSQIDFLKKVIEGKTGTDKVVGIKEDSVNKWLARTLEMLGIDKYKNCKTGIHSVRKMSITEKYFTNINNGMNEKEADKTASQYLGHGENRKDVIDRYVFK